MWHWDASLVSFNNSINELIQVGTCACNLKLVYSGAGVKFSGTWWKLGLRLAWIPSFNTPLAGSHTSGSYTTAWSYVHVQIMIATILKTDVLVLSFSYFFVSVPCARLGWRSRIVSYRIARPHWDELVVLYWINRTYLNAVSHHVQKWRILHGWGRYCNGWGDFVMGGLLIHQCEEFYPKMSPPEDFSRYTPPWGEILPAQIR